MDDNERDLTRHNKTELDVLWNFKVNSELSNGFGFSRGLILTSLSR